MKPQVKKDWTAALTSGKYQQAEGALKLVTDTGTKHCCLGVLCELYVKQVDPKIRWTNDSGGDKRSFKGHEDMPPKEVLEWAGLSTSNAGRLSGMNDNGDSFTEIAKVINDVKITKWANQYGRGVKKVRI